MDRTRDERRDAFEADKARRLEAAVWRLTDAATRLRLITETVEIIATERFEA